MKSHRLRTFVAAHIDGDVKESGLLLDGDMATPQTLELFRKMDRLGLLTDEAVFSLLSQAPVDPYGIYAGLRQHMEGWQFDALKFCQLAIIAKVGNEPVAIMQVDLLCGDVHFITSNKGKLELLYTLTTDTILEVATKHKNSPEKVWEWFEHHIGKVVKSSVEAFNRSKTQPLPVSENS